MKLYNVIDCFNLSVPVQPEEGLFYGDDQILGTDLRHNPAHKAAQHFNKYYGNAPYRVVEAV